MLPISNNRNGEGGEAPFIDCPPEESSFSIFGGFVHRIAVQAGGFPPKPLRLGWYCIRGKCTIQALCRQAWTQAWICVCRRACRNMQRHVRVDSDDFSIAIITYDNNKNWPMNRLCANIHNNRSTVKSGAQLFTSPQRVLQHRRTPDGSEISRQSAFVPRIPAIIPSHAITPNMEEDRKGTQTTTMIGGFYAKAKQRVLNKMGRRTSRLPSYGIPLNRISRITCDTDSALIHP